MKINFYINIIDEPIEKHHLTKDILIGIPKELHQLYQFGPDDKGEKHKFMILQIVKQLYDKHYNVTIPI